MGNVDIISGISTLLTIGFIPPPFPIHFAFHPLHFVLVFLFRPPPPVHFSFQSFGFVLAFPFRPLLPVHFAASYFVLLSVYYICFPLFLHDLNRKGSVSAAFSTIYQSLK
jgi:hypothetical protein